MSKKKVVLILIGIIFFVILNRLEKPDQLSEDAWLIASLLLLMTLWWLTETIPLSVTALLPLLVVPVFTEFSIAEVVQPYSSPIIFLLLGGFIIGLGFQKSELHKRFAMYILAKIGNNKKSILAAFMITTAFLSMWISNTATCLLMLPILISILYKLKIKKENFFRKIIILSIAYSSSIGGMATLIGTAPNAIFAGFLKQNYSIQIDFIKWFFFSFPLVLILLILFGGFANYLIRDISLQSLKNKIFTREYQKLGKISLKEKVTIFIMCVTIFLWIFKSFINDFFMIKLTDANIAILGAFLFFIIPVKNQNFILDKDWFSLIPWNILLLFGGGLSLANLVTKSGISEWIGNSLFFFSTLDIIFMILLIALLISFLTEVTSNTATTILFLPILASFAEIHNLDISKTLLPVVLTASCAFMMPIATPPNAIVFSTNELKITFMASIGFFMNLTAVIISSIWIYYFSNLLL